MIGPGWSSASACSRFVCSSLGGFLAEEGWPETRRWQLGCRLQLAGGALYGLGFGVGVASISPGLKGAPFLVAMAALGVVASVVAWVDHLRLRRGEVLAVADPLGAGERVAASALAWGSPRPPRRRLADGLAIVGGMPIAVGGGAFGMVLLALVAWRSGKPVDAGFWTAIAFFAGCGLIAVWKGLERWETFVPGSRVGPVRLVVSALSFLLFGGALFSIGWAKWSDPAESRLLGALMVAAGGLSLVGGAVFVWRIGRRGRSSVGYALVREGLLERNRRASYLYPWDGIFSVSLGEFHQQTVVYVELAGEEVVRGPAARLGKKRRSLRRSRGLFGAHVIVFDVLANQPLGELYRAAAAALAEPAARAALPAAPDASNTIWS